MADVLYLANQLSHIGVFSGSTEDYPIGLVLNGVTAVRITGMVWDASTSKLFAVTGNADLHIPHRLVELDPTDGTVITVIGNLGTGNQCSDITVDNSGNLWGWAAAAGRLVSIDKSTGVGTPIGASDVNFSGGGIVNISGTIYRIPVLPGVNPYNKIATINLGTGVLTAGPSLSGDTFSISAADIFGGVLYATDNGSNYYTINYSTGVGTFVSGAGIDTLDSICSIPSPPAPGPPPPPPNDNYEDAEVITGTSGSVNGTTLNATDQEPITGVQDVWYKWVAPESGQYNFSSPDAVNVFVYRGDSIDALQTISTGDVFYAIAGNTYYIAVFV